MLGMTGEEGFPLTAGGNDEDAKIDTRIVGKVTIRISPHCLLFVKVGGETSMTEGEGAAKAAQKYKKISNSINHSLSSFVKWSMTWSGTGSL